MTTGTPQLTRRKIAVGIGELAVTADPEATLVVHGLGSCVAVMVHSRQPVAGGLLHVMLPRSAEHRDQSEPTRFADTGIEELLAQMTGLGVNLKRATIKLAGGAAVLGGVSTSDKFRVGARNAEATQETLARLGLTVRATDLGGNRGRTVELDVRDGRVSVRRLGEQAREL